MQKNIKFYNNFYLCSWNKKWFGLKIFFILFPIILLNLRIWFNKSIYKNNIKIKL